MKNNKTILLKIFNFYNLKKICILHLRVFGMIQAHVHKQSNLDDFILDKSFTPRSTPDLYLPRKHNVKNYDVQPKYFIIILQKVIYSAKQLNTCAQYI